MPHGTWFLWVGRNRAQLSGEAGSSPGFTGNPLVSMPRASDSGDPGHASRNGVPDAAFRAANGVGIAMRSISELNPHGLLTHCVRFAPASHPANGNTRYRPARYGFDRAGLAPAGLQQEVSLTHRSSPSSALIPARSLNDPNPGRPFFDAALHLARACDTSVPEVQHRQRFVPACRGLRLPRSIAMRAVTSQGGLW